MDMDGTLVKPCIDFAKLRRSIYDLAVQDGVVPKGDVIALVDKSFSESARTKAHQVFTDIEQQALKDMELMPGMLELCLYLDQAGLQRAILTRNVQTSVDYLHKVHLTDEVPPFWPQVARDSLCDLTQSLIKPKPHPDAIWHICRHWSCRPDQVIMVGDSLQDDIVAGRRAGCWTVHLDTRTDNDSGNLGESQVEERQAHYTISSLQELQPILSQLPLSLERVAK
jgi:phosphoglycolate phosphatase-like HAD superfamily hydrolase